MQSEATVPIACRYLMLATRVSGARFASEKDAAIEWCRKNPDRMDPDTHRALEVLESTFLSEETVAFIQYACYAEIPPGRVYDVSFMLADLTQASTTTRAILRVAIFWGRLPTLSLGHGHHHLVVFDFSNGIPETIRAMPVDCFDGGVSPPTVGLCDWSTWNEIRSSAD